MMRDERAAKPSSLEAERAFLGCMMLDAEAARLGCGLVSAEDFYNPANRAVLRRRRLCGKRARLWTL